MKKRKNIQGVTLIELMVSLLITSVVFLGVISLMTEITSGSRTQDSRTEQTQEARFVLSVMSTDFKNAGSVISLSHTGSFLANTPLFSGIVPLNSTTSSDGVILAAGDPNFLTKTFTEFNPKSDTEINVDKTSLDEANEGDNAKPWEVGDKVMIISTKGYYIASISEVPAGGTSLKLRKEPVYYSKLLKGGGYEDKILMPDGNSPDEDGKAITYPSRSPVIRLNNFSIYLVNDKHELFRVTDTKGNADITAKKADIVGGAIAENIMDMQIVYKAYNDFPNPTDIDRFYSIQKVEGGIQNKPDDQVNNTLLFNDIRNKLMKEINISFVVKTGDYDGKEKLKTKIPSLGDRPAREIDERYTTRVYSLDVELKNYSIIL